MRITTIAAVMTIVVFVAMLAIIETIEEAGESVGVASWTAQEITINGRQCIIVGRSLGNKQWSYEGVSCDWSKQK